MKLIVQLVVLMVAIGALNAQPMEFVVAHYNENLKWLIPYADAAHIYHKGSLNDPEFPVAQWTKLENVGREGHTYLTHIIEQYDTLADVTFFLQGRISDHGGKKTLEALYDETILHGISFLGNTYKFDYIWGRESSTKFWNGIFGVPIPENLVFYPGACFAVKRELIHSHPRAFYEKILPTLAHSSKPREGHWVERMWLYMFDPERAVSSGIA